MLALNEVRAVVRNELISNSKGKVTFYECKERKCVSNSTSPQKKEKFNMEEVVKRKVSLSNFCEKNNAEKIFVKIDAEGEEYNIMEDITKKEALPKKVRGFVEVHESKMKRSEKDIERIMDARNFCFKKVKRKYKNIYLFSNENNAKNYLSMSYAHSE